MTGESYAKEVKTLAKDMKLLNMSQPGLTALYSNAEKNVKGLEAERGKMQQEYEKHVGTGSGGAMGLQKYYKTMEVQNAQNMADRYNAAKGDTQNMGKMLAGVQKVLNGGGPANKEDAARFAVDIDIAKSVAHNVTEMSVSPVSSISGKVERDLTKIRKTIVDQYKLTKEDIAKF